MRFKNTKVTSLMAGVLVSAGAANLAHGQSADAIIDKLVEKGVITVEEANDLRQEADKGFNSAHQIKSGMPDWVTSLKFGGDFRGRYEGFYQDSPAFVDRHRFRYRLRFGAVASLLDNFEAGLRLTSSEPASGGSFGGDPISGNTTFTDNASKKFVYIDLAYGRWYALNTGNLSAMLTIGKMENPFVFSDMIFDSDYTPEGAGQNLTWAVNDKHALKLNLGEFVLEELGGSSHDAYMFGAQLRVDSTWNKQIRTSFGVSGLSIMNEENLGGTESSSGAITWNVPNQNGGNTRTPFPPVGTAGPGGELVANFNPIVVDAGITYTLDSFPLYSGAFPIRLAGDYMYNPGADDNNQAYSIGLTFGKAGKKGTWEVSYKWKELQADAWYEEVVDSDFGGFTGTAYQAGTNTRGHVVRAAYSPYDALTIGLNYFLVGLINEPAAAKGNSDIGRLQVDAIWKF